MDFNVKPKKSNKKNDSPKKSKNEAKKSVLRALNDQLRIRAHRIKSRDESPDKTTDPPTKQTDSTNPVRQKEDSKSRIPVSASKNIKKTRPVLESKPARPLPIPRVESIKHLREKCLQRKFAYIWYRKVHGSVLVSCVHTFRQQWLMKESFRLWKEDWWTNKVEWRLNIRAQCHDRYRLYRHVWSGWKQYVIMSRIKKAKTELAANHYELSRMLAAMTSWKNYQSTRAFKLLLKQRALRLADDNLMRTMWACWRHQLTLENIYKDLDHVAQQFWSSECLTQAWLSWKHAYRDRLLENQKMALAGRHYHVTLRLRCVRALKRSANMRRQKNNIKERVNHLYDRKLLRDYFITWSRRRLTMSVIRQRECDIDQSASRFRLRRLLEYWKHYVRLRQEMYGKEVLAEEHNRARLFSMGLSGLRLAVARSRVQHTRKRLAFEFHLETVQSRTWKIWVSKCETNDEIRTIPEKRLAHKHFCSVLTKRMFIQWKVYINWRRKRQGDYIRAEAFHTMNTLPRYLSALYENAHRSVRKREMLQTANQVYYGNTTAKYFYIWVYQYEVCQEHRTMQTMAILHHEDNLVASYFLQWKIHTAHGIQTREHVTIATRHYMTSLSGRVVEGWRKYVRWEKDWRQNSRLALHHNYMTTLTSAWKLWKRLHEAKRSDSRQQNVSVSHHGNRLLRVAMAAWLQYHHQWQHIKTVVEKKETAYKRQLLRDVFREWRENSVVDRESRMCDMKARLHFNQSWSRKIFNGWREVAVLQSFKREKTVEEVKLVRQQLDHSLLSSCFRRWVSRRDSELLSRLKYQQALIHHTHSSLADCLHRWRSFVSERRQKMLLRHQSAWFNNTRLLVTSFVQWRNVYKEKESENDQTRGALWHWSLVLQAKVFHAWVVYHKDRKRKRMRYSSAMEQRVHNLQIDGLRQWLYAASELQSMREKWTANQETQRAYRIHHLVRRCASDWRHWARRRREERGAGQPRYQDVQPPSRDMNIQMPSRDTTDHVERSEKRSEHNLVPTVKRILEPKLSHSPISVTVTRPKPRLPDFLVASVEASMTRRKEKEIKEKLLHKIDDDCELPTNQNAPSQSRDHQQPINELHLNTFAKLSRDQPIGDSYSEGGLIPLVNLSRPMTAVHASRPQISSSYDHVTHSELLVSNRQSDVISTSNASENQNFYEKTRIQLMTPEMFMTSQQRTTGLMTSQQRTTGMMTSQQQTTGMMTSSRYNALTEPYIPQPTAKPRMRLKQSGVPSLVETLDDVINKPETEMSIYSPEEELTAIRNRLLAYKNRRTELSLMKNQVVELEELLRHDESTHLRHELNKLRNEMVKLVSVLEERKSDHDICVARARLLMATLAK